MSVGGGSVVNGLLELQVPVVVVEILVMREEMVAVEMVKCGVESNVRGRL